MPTLDLKPPGSLGAATGTTVTATTGLVLPKTSGLGVKVDTASPTFGWQDITGHVQPKASGTGSPTRAVYNGGTLADYAFAVNDLCDFLYHIPHDYVPGSDLFWHVHWSHNGTDITGNVVFTAYFSTAKGFNQANFTAEKTQAITYNTTNIATTPQYRHRVDEMTLSTNGGAADKLDSAAIEVDGVILLTMKVTTLPTITGGNLFVHTSDIHYQSIAGGTKNKAPDFYA